MKHDCPVDILDGPCGECENEKEELDTSYEGLATCPWCGHKDHDSWELEDGEYDCGECSKPFEVYRNVDVHYSTHKVIK